MGHFAMDMLHNWRVTNDVLKKQDMKKQQLKLWYQIYMKEVIIKLWQSRDYLCLLGRWLLFEFQMVHPWFEGNLLGYLCVFGIGPFW
jgi:hypothetical protein